MAHQAIPTTPTNVNTPSTYRLAGSCSTRTYVACDDTPYWEEQPITVTLANPDPNHTPERAAKVRAVVRMIGGGRWSKVSAAMLALIDANPDATVAELIGMLN